nr:cytochrome P450 1A1-like [Ciona intestinalis]|eukprot:XP_009858581.1 cytochrome P450 1A1-like [Ciona intestinalis]
MDSLVFVLVDTVLVMKYQILLFLVIVYAIKLLATSQSRRLNIPGPYPWPVIGNVIEMGGQPQFSLTNMAKKYGPVYLMKLGTADVLVLNNYEVIKEALLRQRRIFGGRPIFDSFKKISQGRGVVFNSTMTQGDEWMKLKMTIVKHVHRFVSSEETKGYVAHHVQMEAVELVRILTEKCRSSPNKVIFPIEQINLAIANVVCAIMFGHRYQHGNKEFQDLISLNEQFGDVIGSGSQVDVIPWMKIFPKFRNALKVFDFLTNRLNDWMRLRTKEHRLTYKHGVIRDIVDSFIAESIDHPEQSALNDDVIMALTTDVFGAGQDTMSTTMQWVFVYMMHFKECQRKIHAELDSVIGPGELPHISDRRRLPYLEAVMHEIFRHSTFTSTTIPHVTTQDTVLDGHFIPKGILVFINQFGANHDPNHWVDPDKFIPERFLDGKGNLISRPHDRYLLFSTGARKCPGDELSRMLILHFMATMFALCEVSSDPKKPATLDAVYNLSMRPKELRTIVRSRNLPFLKNSVAQMSEADSHVLTVPGETTSFLTSRVESTVPDNQESQFSDNDFEKVDTKIPKRKVFSRPTLTHDDINGNNVRKRGNLHQSAMYRIQLAT